MSSLVLQDNHKQHLKLLQQHSDQVLTDFCQLAWDFLNNGPSLKLYHAASQKLGIDVQQVESQVEGLVYLFIEVNKHQLNEQHFRETLLSLGFKEEAFAILFNEYSSHKPILDEALPLVGTEHSQYRNLEWRFQTQVAAKSIKNQCKTNLVLRLDLERNGSVESVILESDIPNVIHMSQMLNQALQESRTQQSRIRRNVS